METFFIRQRIIILTIILIISVFSFALAEGIEKISLDDLIRITLKNNKAILASKKEVSGANIKVSKSYRELYPLVSVSAESYYYEKKPYKQDGADTEDREIIPGVRIPANILSSSNLKYYTALAGATLYEPLYNQKLLSNIQIAKTYKNIAELNLSMTERDVIYNLIDKYFTLLEMENRYDLILMKIELYREILNNSVRKTENSESGPLLRIESEINLKLAENELVRTDKEKRNLENDLFSLMGVDSFKYKLAHHDSSFAFISQELNEKELMRRALKYSYEINKIDASIRQTKQEITLAYGESIPVVNIFSNVNYLKNASYFGDSFEKLDRTWSAGLKLEWKFFDSGRSVKQAQELKAKIESNRIEKEKAIINLKNDLSRLLSDLEFNSRLIEIQALKEELTRKKLDIADEYYAKGKLTRSELIQKKIAFEDIKYEKMRIILTFNRLKEKLKIMTNQEEL